MKTFEHKGYTAEVFYSEEDHSFVAQVRNIDALIMVSASHVDDLVNEFRHAVDAYLDDCAAANVKPDTPYKGSFNVRVGPDCHRRAAQIARTWGVSLNELVKVAIDQVVDRHVQRRSVTVMKSDVFVTDLAYEAPGMTAHTGSVFVESGYEGRSN